MLSQGGEGVWPQLPATHASHCAPSSRWLPPSSRPKGCPHSRGTSAALLLPRASSGALLIESPPQLLCTPAPASWAGHTSICMYMYQHLWPHPQTCPPHEHIPGGGLLVEGHTGTESGLWWRWPLDHVLMAEPTVSSHWQPGTHCWARWPRAQHVREGGREEVRSVNY